MSSHSFLHVRLTTAHISLKAAIKSNEQKLKHLFIFVALTSCHSGDT